VNTVAASFNTTMRQTTEISQRKRTVSIRKHLNFTEQCPPSRGLLEPVKTFYLKSVEISFIFGSGTSGN